MSENSWEFTLPGHIEGPVGGETTSLAPNKTMHGCGWILSTTRAWPIWKCLEPRISAQLITGDVALATNNEPIAQLEGGIT